MFKKLKKNQKGFTLVELVVVIAILAVLSALLIPRIMGNVDEARTQREIADARTLASEISVYNANQTTLDVPAPILTSPVTEASVAVLGGNWTGENFPDTTVVEITIDAEGNPTVVEK